MFFLGRSRSGVVVLGFGVLLARSAMVAVNDSLPETNRFKRHTRIQEALSGR
jgi:hypothetical protein